MARTAEGAALSVQHRNAQLRIRAQALQGYQRIWPLWRGDEASFTQLIQASVPLVNGFRQMSSALASGYYEAFRRIEGVGGSPTPRVAPPADTAAVASSLYITGRNMTNAAIAAGQSPQAAMQTAFVRTSGAVTRHVLDGGRHTIVLSTAKDSEARGFTRVTSGNPCAFCAMLSGRGAVYGEETSEFQAHDHCSCAGEPSYDGSEWPGRADEFARLWDTSGASMSDTPLNTFRRALEGSAE